MKYVDYPLPDEKVVEILSKEYGKKNTVCALSNLEQQASLNELCYKIELSNKFLDKFHKMGATATQNASDINTKHLETIKSFGVSPNVNIDNHELGNSKTCFYNYLRCEIDILKTLMFLIFLDNLRYSKSILTQMANERLSLISECVS